MLLISSLLFILLGGVLYIIRGGGFGDQYSDIATWLSNHNLPSMRNLYIVGLFLLPLISWPFLAVNGISGWALVVMLGAIAAGYILTLVSGWSAYYSMGSNDRYYQEHRCVLWIDYILYKLYGPMLIPANANNPDPVAFDLIQSPDGQPNTYDWLHKRAVTGMVLRFVHSLALFGLIALAKHYMMGETTGAIIAALMFLPMMLTGLIYDYFVTPETLATESSNPWRFEQPIGKSEVVTGMWLHLLIVIAVFI